MLLSALHRRLLPLLAVGTLLMPLAAPLRAQVATGTVVGRVSDASSGASLRGAVVRLAGPGRTSTTDGEGRFRFVGVPTGQFQVEAAYVGLETGVSPVTVTAGEVVLVDFALSGGELRELEEFVVTATASGQIQAINQQRTALGIVNIVSEESFGAIVDGNIGQALQRLPGISVDEDQDGSAGSINIRGISGEFNSVQVDGNRVPSSGGSRAFNPRDLAGDGVTTVEIVKAPTPDRDGDAIGGIVNLVSRSAFQREGMAAKLKAGASLNDLSDNWGHAISASWSDLFSVGGGEKNLGLSLSVSSYDTDRYSINADQDWVRVTTANNPTLGLEQYDVPVWFMEATHWEYDTRETTTRTISASVDFRTDERNSFYVRPLVSMFDRTGVKFETDTDIDTRFQDAVGGRKTYAALTPTSGRGTQASRGSMGWIGTLDEQDNLLASVAVGGRHDGDSGYLSWDAFYSRNKRDVEADTELNMLMEPDSPYFEFAYEIVDPRGFITLDILNGLDPTDLSQMTEGELIVVDSEKTEEVGSARLDWLREFQVEGAELAIKAGAKVRRSEQFFDQSATVYAMDETFPYAQVLSPTNEVLLLKPKYFDVSPTAGLELLRTNPGLFELVEDDTLEDSNIADYDATETTSAAYVMATYEQGPHKVIAGVRLERAEWDNSNKRVSYLNEVATVTPVVTGNSENFWLPGLHFRHEITEKLILRESYNRSYGRPRLEELSRGRWVDDDGNIEDGNPNLVSATSDNFDIQLEYYTQRGGLLSVGVFYKQISDFTFTALSNFDVVGADGNPVIDPDGDLEWERPVNGTEAENLGIELIARQPLYFLPGPLRGLIASASATFTDSKADYPNRTDRDDLALEGFSDTIWTLALDYVWKGFSARVDYRFRSEYIEGLGDSIETDEFYDEEYRIDAEMAYRFRNGVSLVATGANLTAKPQISYSGYAQFVEDASYAGRKFTFGVEYSF